MKPDLITHNRGSGFQSRFEIVGMKEGKGTGDEKQHALLVNLEGSQVPPVLSTKPHTHPLLLQQCPCCGFRIKWFWPKLELSLVPLNFGAEKKI